MSGVRLACPVCGNADLWSDEPASIMYPVEMVRRDGMVTPHYTGDSYLVMDEGTRYVGDIWCRACGNQLRPDELVPAAEV